MINYMLLSSLDLSFPGQTLAYMILGIIAAIIAAIVLIRMQMSKKSESGELTTKYANLPKRSPLEGRNKYGAVDVLRNSGTVFNIGLAISLLFTVLAFSWTKYDKQVNIPDNALEIDEDIEIEPPRTAEPPPPPPPPPPPVIEEVPEEEIIEEEEPTFVDQDIDEDEEIEVDSEEPVEVEEEPEPVVEEVEEEPEEEKIFKVVEDMPRFPGCEGKGLGKAELKKCAEDEMLKFIYSNIKYPAVARENGIEGRAILRFMVDKDGSVRNIEVLRDPGGGTGKEAKRVVEKMNSMGQKWIPGKQRGKAVKVFYTLPVSFKLQG
ncbi:MAG TPA: energy transducer TonB [Phaeodactylibacter sp.]|nr:energy transducer TonB [Phaeodactylibacter sp.]